MANSRSTFNVSDSGAAASGSHRRSSGSSGGPSRKRDVHALRARLAEANKRYEGLEKERSDTVKAYNKLKDNCKQLIQRNKQLRSKSDDLTRRLLNANEHLDASRSYFQDFKSFKANPDQIALLEKLRKHKSELVELRQQLEDTTNDYFKYREEASRAKSDLQCIMDAEGELRALIDDLMKRELTLLFDIEDCRSNNDQLRELCRKWQHDAQLSEAEFVASRKENRAMERIVVEGLHWYNARLVERKKKGLPTSRKRPVKNGAGVDDVAAAHPYNRNESPGSWPPATFPDEPKMSAALNASFDAGSRDEANGDQDLSTTLQNMFGFYRNYYDESRDHRGYDNLLEKILAELDEDYADFVPFPPPAEGPRPVQSPRSFAKRRRREFSGEDWEDVDPARLQMRDRMWNALHKGQVPTELPEIFAHDYQRPDSDSDGGLPPPISDDSSEQGH